MKATVWTASIFAALLSSVGCQDARISVLEQRVQHLETENKRLSEELEKERNETSGRRADLELCVKQANAAYDNGLASNGTKTRSGFSLPVSVMEELDRQRKDKIEQCKLLYSQ